MDYLSPMRLNSDGSALLGGSSLQPTRDFSTISLIMNKSNSNIYSNSSAADRHGGSDPIW